MSEEKQAFDAGARIIVPVLSGGEKRCEVRFPSDDEWAEWARSQRTVRRFLGRGKSQSDELGLPKINAELLRKIRLDADGPDFDEAEAGIVIQRLQHAQILSVDREGPNCRVTMRALGAQVAHVLRIPTAREVEEFERASTSVVSGRRSVEVRTFLEPGGALYDNLHVADEGYAGCVPLVHKSAAVSEVIAEASGWVDEDYV